MAVNKNTDTQAEIRQVLQLQLAQDTMPVPIPVVEVNPKITQGAGIIKRNFLTNATSATVYTVPAETEFLLSSLTLSYTKDATATATNIGIGVVPTGQASEVKIVDCATTTLTADTRTVCQSFPMPIRCKSGSNIRVLSDTSVANVQAIASIQGMLVPINRSA